VLFEVPFLTIARCQIVWVIPSEESNYGGDKQ
jgi:hypothetical protein